MSPKNPKELSSSNLFPYPLQEDNISLFFVTNSEVTYRLFFTSDVEYLPGDAVAELTLSFSIVPVNGPDSRKDPRIKPTIAVALRRVFDHNSDTIILYTCSTDNAQEVMRSRLFNAWYIMDGKGYLKLDHKDFAARAHTSIIFRENHPLEVTIRYTFQRVYIDK